MTTTPQASPPPAGLFDSLRTRYPRTVAAFSGMERGEQALAAVSELERQWGEVNARNAPTIRDALRLSVIWQVPHTRDLPEVPEDRKYDVVIAGGGLGLVAGVALSRRGFRVLVFDRHRVGSAHREWNISERELGALVRWGIFSRDELSRVVANRYSSGLISFSADNTGVPFCPLRVDGVLDVALDAQAVLDLARSRFLELGGTILENRSFQRLHSAQHGPAGSVFELAGPEGTEQYGARLAIDTMGSVSPLAMALNGGLPFDGVCPTAGTIVRGLDLDPAQGDVLVSVAGTTGGRQLIWEGFPGRDGEATVYLFYYDRTGPQASADQSLLDLFEKYFELLPGYRTTRPDFRHVKPVFGYIPARHGRAGRTAARGLLCLGDSAAGQSPLTFCGFGSFVRHIGRVADLIAFALRNDLLEEKHLRAISPHQANLRVAWVFSRFMQPWRGAGENGVNRLMNIFCRALADAGPQTTVRFLQDRYTFRDYLAIMLLTARRYPGVFNLTARVLGVRGLSKWALDIAHFGVSELGRLLYSVPGRRAWTRIEAAAGRVSPSLALRLRAAGSSWRATR